MSGDVHAEVSEGHTWTLLHFKGPGHNSMRKCSSPPQPKCFKHRYVLPSVKRKQNVTT